MEKLIIWGIGQISDVLTYYIKRDCNYEISGYLVDGEYKIDDTHNEVPVYEFNSNFSALCSPNEYKLAFPISFKGINKIREEKYRTAKAMGYSFISYVSPNAICDALTIGENTFVFDMTVIQPFAKLGNNTIVWSGSHIGHHSVIGDNCFIASAKIAGCVNIEDNVFVGVGSTVCDTITVGHHSIVGGGSVVNKTITPESVVMQKQSKVADILSYEIEDLLC